MDEILAGCRDHVVKHWTADHWLVGSPSRMSRGGGGGGSIITHQSCSKDCLTQLNHAQTGDLRHHSFPWMRFRERLLCKGSRMGGGHVK